MRWEPPKTFWDSSTRSVLTLRVCLMLRRHLLEKSNLPCMQVSAPYLWDDLRTLSGPLGPVRFSLQFFPKLPWVMEMHTKALQEFAKDDPKWSTLSASWLKTIRLIESMCIPCDNCTRLATCYCISSRKFPGHDIHECLYDFIVCKMWHLFVHIHFLWRKTVHTPFFFWDGCEPFFGTLKESLLCISVSSSKFHCASLIFQVSGTAQGNTPCRAWIPRLVSEALFFTKSFLFAACWRANFFSRFRVEYSKHTWLIQRVSTWNPDAPSLLFLEALIRAIQSHFEASSGEALSLSFAENPLNTCTYAKHCAAGLNLQTHP